MTGPFVMPSTVGSFTLIMAAAPIGEPVIAPWHPAPVEASSFSPEAAGQQNPIWRVDLPSNPGQARAILEKGRQSLASEQIAMIQTFEHLELLARTMREPGAHELRGPEAELIATITQSGAVQNLSFDVTIGSIEGLAESAGTWLQAAWERVQALIARTTWTETVIDGRLIARSALGRTGDILTAWFPTVMGEQAALHNRAVQLALASKRELLRKLTLVIRGAMMVTGLVTVPGSALLAIPAIWRYMNQIRAELNAD